MTVGSVIRSPDRTKCVASDTGAFSESVACVVISNFVCSTGTDVDHGSSDVGCHGNAASADDKSDTPKAAWYGEATGQRTSGSSLGGFIPPRD